MKVLLVEHNMQPQLIQVMGFHAKVARTAIKLKELTQSTIFSSDPVAAKKFKKWIGDDQVPCVRLPGESTKKPYQVVTLFQSKNENVGKVD